MSAFRRYATALFIRPRTWRTEWLQVCLLPDIRPNLKLRSNHHAEAQIVVAIAGAVVVPISHTAVLRIVVPAAAAIHAVRPRFRPVAVLVVILCLYRFV